MDEYNETCERCNCVWTSEPLSTLRLFTPARKGKEENHYSKYKEVRLCEDCRSWVWAELFAQIPSKPKI